MLFDSHAHINDAKTQEERNALTEEISQSGIISFVADIGYDLPSSEQAALNAKEYDWIVAAVGVHPHDSGTMDEAIFDKIKKLAESPCAHAIGEIGLDYHYMHSEKEDQRYWFRRQIRLANELNMPIVVHSREADKETMDILVEEGAFTAERAYGFDKRVLSDGSEVPDPHVVIHCFSGSAELASEYIKLGATIGICGPLTYKNNKKTVRVAEVVPIEYMMVETDSPYLAPEPMRGRRNTPVFVEYTARKLAEIKGMSFDAVSEITERSARRFYRI